MRGRNRAAVQFLVFGANSLDSKDSTSVVSAAERKLPGPSWLRVGAFAMASAFVGGLAAAWFYRKTLTQFQNAGSNEDSNFRTGNEIEEED
jgi:hypothetical protein